MFLKDLHVYTLASIFQCLEDSVKLLGQVVTKSIRCSEPIMVEKGGLRIWEVGLLCETSVPWASPLGEV